MIPLPMGNAPPRDRMWQPSLAVARVESSRVMSCKSRIVGRFGSQLVVSASFVLRRRPALPSRAGGSSSPGPQGGCASCCSGAGPVRGGHSAEPNTSFIRPFPSVSWGLGWVSWSGAAAYPTPSQHCPWKGSSRVDEPPSPTCPPSLSDRKSTRLNSSHIQKSRMPSSA